MVFRDRVRSALSALTKERTPGAVLYNTMAKSMGWRKLLRLLAKTIIQPVE